jgi:glycerate 2-kinase
MIGPHPPVAAARGLLVRAFRAALEAVEPERVVREHLETQEIPGDVVKVVAIGKAAAGMCRGAAGVLGDRILGGVAVSDHQERVPPGIRLFVGGHPYPDEHSLFAGSAVLAEARHARPDETMLVLVSGGGSALAEALPPGVDLDDVTATHRLLMNAGVPIERLNTVRRHLSTLKHGGLLRASGARTVVTLLISDVVDGPPTAIASGPTLPDESTPADALAVIAEAGLRDRVPTGVLGHLEAAEPPPPPGPHHQWAVVANGSTAAHAVQSELLRSEGLRAPIVTTTLRGEASVQGRRMVEAAQPGMALIAAGETTVTVRGGGSGGRCQEAALAAALAIDGSTDILFGAFATDGVDGPTNAAGAVVDGGTVARIRAAGIDPEAALAANDSHRALDASGDLVTTGPTGTNVSDLWIAWRAAAGI